MDASVPLLCHVATPDDVAAATGGVLRRMPFLHCCTEEQLPFVLLRHFAGQSGLLVLRFAPSAVQGRIEWERSEPDQDPFPHVYGGLLLASVLTEAVR